MALSSSSVFSVIPSDINFLQRQQNSAHLKIVRYDFNGQPIYGYIDHNNSVHELGAVGTFDAGQRSLYVNVSTPSSIKDPHGFRTISGVYNNLLPGRETWGATDEAFLRLTSSVYSNYLGQNISNPAFNPGRYGPGSPGFQEVFQTAAQGQTIEGGIAYSSALYADPFKTVVDYTPRMISQMVSSQDALNRLGIASSGSNNSNEIPFIPNSRQGNGLFTLFGQYFDHGLDFIEKGGNIGANGSSAKLIIPLSPFDPLYNPAQGVTSITVSRATVKNPLSAGPDGQFRTLDDIHPGADGEYGTTDDVRGPVDPVYLNRTSAYSDLSQAYGSDEQITQLLREWVVDPNSPGQYRPGSSLLSGYSLETPWEFVQSNGMSTLTRETVPTLRELRSHLVATGRADLTWQDVQNYRARDSQGQILDADPNKPGLQAIQTHQALLLDANPHFDAARLYQNGRTPDTTGVLAGVSLSSTLDARGLPTTINVNGTDYGLSKYINFNGFSVQAHLNEADAAIANELLLRSVGDHYIAGDGRLNENFGLTTLHHVFHESHIYHLNSIKTSILDQQSKDPTRSVGHAWQVKVISHPTQPLSSGVQVIADHYEDAQGNYVTASGEISWHQDKLFEAARLITQTEYQHLTVEYAQFVTPDIPKFSTYNPDVNAGVSMEYSQAAFRFGHSQLRETIDLLDPNGSLTSNVQKFALKTAFLNPQVFAEHGPASVALGMARQVSSEIDEFITPALQQTLLGQPLDLAAINLIRGRDVGLPTLNETRKQLHDALLAEKQFGSLAHSTLSVESLNPYQSWNDFRGHMIHPQSLVNFIAAYSFDGHLEKAQAIVDLYEGKIYQGTSAAQGFTYAQAYQFLNGGDQGFQKIDLWLGGLAEKHVSGGQLGSTFNTIFVDQMQRLQDGDRFYYLHRVDSEFQEVRGIFSQIEANSVKDLIERTTGARHLQGNIFESVDKHLELGEVATSSPGTEHKYGGLSAVTQNHYGVYSRVASDPDSTFNLFNWFRNLSDQNSPTNNGKVSVVKGQSYVLDSRVEQSSTEKVVIGGTQNNDYIVAGNGGNTIYGEGGHDILVGAKGVDFLYGGTQNDDLSGKEGDDILNGGIGADVIHGDAGDDLIVGEVGNDTLYGDAGNDELHGGDGDDRIYVGSGNNRVFGSEGDDTVYLDSAKSNFLVSFSRSSSLNSSSSDGITFKVADRTGASGENHLIDVEVIQFQSGGSYSIVTGENENNTLSANSVSAQLMASGAGNDLLFGERDSDFLWGEEGDDFLNGAGLISTGVNTVDTMTGGHGNDVFVLGQFGRTFYDDGALNDFGLSLGIQDYAFITDFSAGDKIQLAGVAANYTLVANTSVGGQTGIGLYRNNHGPTTGSGVYSSSWLASLRWNDDLIGLIQGSAANSSLNLKDGSIFTYG